MNWENEISFLAIEGDWRRLQARTRMIPAEIQKRRLRIGLFLVWGIMIRPFETIILSRFTAEKQGHDALTGDMI